MPTIISKSKKAVFYLILILSSLLLLCLVEIAFRVFDMGTDLSLFVDSKQYKGYCEVNKDIAKRYFTNFHATTPSNDVFLKEKPDTAFRIFVMGCSTARGFPYQMGNNFSRILYYRLQDAFPHKRIEVVNCALAATSSFSLADMIDDILDYQPDAILIYNSHNEYYGTLGVGSVEKKGNFIWLKRLRLKLLQLRTYQMVQDMVYGLMSKSNKDKDQPMVTLMQSLAQEKSILYGSELFNEGIHQFDVNISKVLHKAKKHHVSVILSELVSNIRDQEPFGSQATHDLPAAMDVYRQAQQLEQDNQLDEAKALYYKAKDLDIIRFRAPEAINEVIHRLGKKYDCPVVPMKRIFEQHSPNGLIGNNLMIEHLHPTIDGYFLMADAFFQEMKASHLISDQWNNDRIRPSSWYRRNWGFTELDSLYVDQRIQMLKASWPFTPNSKENKWKETYIPKSFIDSVAFSNTPFYETKHIYLARTFSSLKQDSLAFNEYLSVIRCHPYLFQLYLDATPYLISQGKYLQALELLGSAPNKTDLYAYYYTTGTINRAMGRSKWAIQDFNRAVASTSEKKEKEKALIALFKLYQSINDTGNASNTLALIKEINPRFRGN